ncbi:hypothetical protein MIND_00572800 [Mycena indigotica]|uniref:Uncharacterized protein n=1 Tax=Mycena indigotica TaxID=2126181 RepID=A0A8H6SP60_9AGAR|nr:uncharacterized protein MIND_00572800 [Mycena indigotica]KAF7303440.1 hypothetical protein MIND_00572800 [Mycena indigotica]
MPAVSKAKKKKAEVIVQNRLNSLARSAAGTVKRVFAEISYSPQKLASVFSPRKRRKRQEDKENEVRGHTERRASRMDTKSTCPVTDPFLVSQFRVDGDYATPTEAPAFTERLWRLPKSTDELNNDVDFNDTASIDTFAFLSSSPTLIPSPTDYSSPRPFPTSPTLPTTPDFAEFIWDFELDEPILDDLFTLEHEDELLAINPCLLFHDEGYPRPPPPESFIERMSRHSTRPGKLREAPLIAEAKLAAGDIHIAARGNHRGSPTNLIFGRAGVGYRDPGFSPFTRNRMWGIQAMLNFYVNPGSTTYGNWGESASMAAIMLNRGRHCARVLARLTRQYIVNREILNLNPYGRWTTSMLADEDLANKLRLHIQSLGTEITAEKVRAYLLDPEVRQRHEIDRDISLRTAQRYLTALGYRWTYSKKGQYVDGHERADVVQYRNQVYLPRLFELNRRVHPFDSETGEPIETALAPGRRVIIWYHDESIFYAHDRRRKTWYHKDAAAVPYRKGEGVSYMVADYFSAEFGWLRHPLTGARAREAIRPGKNRDGYFSAVKVVQQAEKALAIVQDAWPDYDHIFIYDNATTHRKRAEGALSARAMPKFTSGSKNSKHPDANLLVEVNRRVNGQLVYDPQGRLVKDKIRMTGAYYGPDKTPQDLYYADDHPDETIHGKFKGMRQLLIERGLSQYADLRTECPKFKCEDTTDSAQCCCRRILFNQPDFAAVKSILEDTCSEAGVEVLFLPKFHCELNPIEMVWGYAKRIYRTKPESSKEEDLEKNTLDSLEEVPILCMRRYVNRSYRFAQGYGHLGLSGAELAWASKRYHGHRTFPNFIFQDLVRAGLRDAVPDTFCT